MNEESITFTDNGDNSLTLRISGAAYQNIAKIAETMNSVAWCDKDNTALTIAETFMFVYETDNLTDAKGSTEIAEFIADGIDTGTADEAEDKKRKNELIAAFRQVKFIEG